MNEIATLAEMIENVPSGSCEEIGEVVDCANAEVKNARRLQV